MNEGVHPSGFCCAFATTPSCRAEYNRATAVVHGAAPVVGASVGQGVVVGTLGVVVGQGVVVGGSVAGGVVVTIAQQSLIEHPSDPVHKVSLPVEMKGAGQKKLEQV